VSGKRSAKVLPGIAFNQATVFEYLKNGNAFDLLLIEMKEFRGNRNLSLIKGY
jgi:hypothetical protein